jgi:hypothetical protein
MSYRCRLCDRVFDSIPEGSIQIGGDRRVYVLYRFPDKTVHDIRLSAKIQARPDCKEEMKVKQALPEPPTPEPESPTPAPEPQEEPVQQLSFKSFEQLKESLTKQAALQMERRPQEHQ